MARLLTPELGMPPTGARVDPGNDKLRLSEMSGELVVVVEVHMTEEAVKAVESIVNECLKIKFYHILNKDVLDRLWLQIWLILDKLKWEQMQ